MKKIAIYLIIIISSILIFTGCNNNSLDNTNMSESNLTYIGEGDYWKASYILNLKNGIIYNSLDIKLKDPTSAAGLMEYSLFENGEKKTYGTGNIGSKIGGTGGGTGQMLRKDEKYVVEIKWNDGHDQETIPLKLKQ